MYRNFIKTLVFFFLGIIIFQTNLYSQSLLNNVLNRQKTLLNGDWNYIVDPYETGYYDFRMNAYDQQKNPSNAAYFKNYHAKDKQELVEYDFDKSPKMAIPNDWNSQDEKLFYYEGSVWFKKSFDYDLKENRRLFVHFGAVNYIAEVYLNSTKLGVHEGGFTPFNFEISKIVKPKDNFLVVKVDNKRRADGVPTLNTDWWNYGGITRDVLLIEEPATFIQNYNLQLKRGEKDKISGFVKFENPANNESISISIPELKFEKNLTSDTNGKAEFEFSVPKLELWSPENPKLYQVFIKTKYQTLKDDIGFRTVETRGADILLNGKPIFLRGISIHEENATGGRGNSRADAARLLNWARDLGCNFVRLAHYPHSENMVKMADEMGMLVWEEIPVYWTIDFTKEEILNKSKQQLNEVITRDSNRASVIIWSMANETPISETRNKFIKNLVDYTKTLDSTRLISAALMHRQANGLEILDDPIGEYMDIMAFNQYLGWYGGNLADAENKKWSIPFNKPVVVSEFGGDAKFGLHGTKDERWTEEYQEYLYQQNLKMIDKIPNIRGLSPWILVDFRSPRRVLPNVQDGYNRKGLISNDGNRKLAFFVLQNYYQQKKLMWNLPKVN